MDMQMTRMSISRKKLMVWLTAVSGVVLILLLLNVWFAVHPNEESQDILIEANAYMSDYYGKQEYFDFLPISARNLSFKDMRTEDMSFYMRYAGFLEMYLYEMQDGIFRIHGRPNSLYEYRDSHFNLLMIDFTKPLEGLTFSYAVGPDCIQIDCPFFSSGIYGKEYPMVNSNRESRTKELYEYEINKMLTFLSLEYMKLFDLDSVLIEDLSKLTPANSIYIYCFENKKMLPYTEVIGLEWYVSSENGCIQIKYSE